MLCRNCNYILSGEEDFCPHCGQALKTQEIKDTQKDVPMSEEPLPKPKAVNSIFESESLISSDEEEIRPEKKRKSKGAFTLVSLFVFILIIIAVFTAAEYFDLAPAISSFISQQGYTPSEKELVTTSQSELSGSEGLVPPEISYKPAVCTATSQKALPLRKGPGDNFAQVGTVPYGTRLQITGGSLSSDLWVYVYIPSTDCYGWLCASYLTDDSNLESTALSAQSEKNESTAPSSTEKSDEDESQQALSPNAYTAKVTAEKGLYLRVGPGTDFEALKVIGKDEEITVLEVCAINPSWLYVQWKNEKGYVNGSFVNKT